MRAWTASLFVVPGSGKLTVGKHYDIRVHEMQQEFACTSLSPGEGGAKRPVAAAAKAVPLSQSY